jgi:hypothetical protein
MIDSHNPLLNLDEGVTRLSAMVEGKDAEKGGTAENCGEEAELTHFPAVAALVSAAAVVSSFTMATPYQAAYSPNDVLVKRHFILFQFEICMRKPGNPAEEVVQSLSSSTIQSISFPEALCAYPLARVKTGRQNQR